MFAMFFMCIKSESGRVKESLHYVGFVNGCDFLSSVASGIVESVLCNAT